MLGQVKKVNPEIKWMHCIVHREALAIKRMSPDLSAVMDDTVKTTNFIQSDFSKVFAMRAARNMTGYCFTQTSAGCLVGKRY